MDGGVLLCGGTAQVVSTLDAEFIQGELLFTAARAELVGTRCCWRRLIVHLLISHLALSSATDISPALRRLISRLKSREKSFVNSSSAEAGKAHLA